MKILITGGSGMVGRNLLECSAFSGHHEMLAPSRSELNLLDGPAVEAWLRKEKPDIVIHCAGRVGGIQANMSSPCEFLVENFEMGKNAILGAALAGIPRLLNMGSSCMYPRGHLEALREEMVLTGELEPTNEGYALAKIVSQRLCRYIGMQMGPHYKTLIPCNLYGRHDKFDPVHGHLVPAVIDKLHRAKREGAKSVEIWGDGQARREFMYAADLADFVARAIERYEELPELLNVGLGFDYSINEYYQTIAEVVGYRGKFHHNLDRPVGMSRKLVSVERLAQFGWKAPTSLKAGVEKAYRFYLDKQ